MLRALLFQKEASKPYKFTHGGRRVKTRCSHDPVGVALIRSQPPQTAAAKITVAVVGQAHRLPSDQPCQGWQAERLPYNRNAKPSSEFRLANIIEFHQRHASGVILAAHNRRVSTGG